jgi:phytoene desaturase
MLFDMRKVTVIGSGIASLATAIRLRTKGYDVHVFEKNSYPGGKLTVLESNGFRFDAGPSVFTLPELVTELFELAGKNPTDYFQYIRHDISAKYFWNDGTIFTAPAYKEKFIEVASQQFDEPKENIRKYLADGERKYHISKPVFLEKSVHLKKNYFSKEYLKSYPALITMDVFKSLHRTNKKFIRNPKLVQVLDKFASYIGSDPYRTPGIMSLMPHLEITEGVYFPKNGMHDIVKSLCRLAEDIGVTFHFQSPVEKIETQGKRVTGIVCEGKFVESDVVFCGTDVHFAHKHLLKEQKLPKSVLQERSSSVVVFYWGINKKFEQLDLHNMFYPDDYASEFKGIFETGKIIQDMSVYIHRSCEVVKSDAPEGKENWFVMIMTPSDSNLVDDKSVSEIRKNTIEKLNKILKTDLEKHIVFEDYLSPRLIEEKTNSYQGALHGISSNSAFSFFKRHSNFSRSYKNLYFVGGSTHPGGGIPQCLHSAKIATKHV